jgi:hypothetical protein
VTVSNDYADEQEFLAPADDQGWHYTTMRDWIAVCPDISATAIRLYWIIRSIMHEKGDKSRRLSVDQLCWLMPGINGKPCSATRIKDGLRELEEAGLLSNPDGAVTRQWVIDPKTGKQTKENFRRWRIHDYAPRGYDGWKSAIAKLAAYPGPGWQADADGRKTASQTRPAQTPDTEGSPAGRTEGRKSGESGRKSAPPRRKSGDSKPPTSANEPAKESFQRSSLTNQPAREAATRPVVGPTAVGRSVGERDEQAPTSPGVALLAALPQGPGNLFINRHAPKVDALLDAGWPAAELVRRWTAHTGQVGDPLAVLAFRITDLRLSPPPGTTEQRKQAMPDWCTKCDPNTRLKDKPGGGFEHCSCHPAVARATAAAH